MVSVAGAKPWTVESRVPADRVCGGRKCGQGQFPPRDIIWNSNTQADKGEMAGTTCVEIFSNRFGGFIGGDHRHKTVGSLYPPMRALPSAKQISACSDLVWGMILRDASSFRSITPHSSGDQASQQEPSQP